MKQEARELITEGTLSDLVALTEHGRIPTKVELARFIRGQTPPASAPPFGTAQDKLSASLTLIGDEEIRFKLEQIQPEGFNWTDIAECEMVKFKAVAQEQRAHNQREVDAGKGK